MSFTNKLLATAALSAGVALALPASAQVGVGVQVGPVGASVGTPAPAYYYGTGYYPPGPCAAYNYYYNGDCGYPVYSGDVDFDGAVVTGPHYYRWTDDHPTFWYRGGWHEWNGWNRTHRDWDHRAVIINNP